MKKIFTVLIIACMLFSLTACGDNSGNESSVNSGATSGFEVVFFDIENLLQDDGTIKHYYGTGDNLPDVENKSIKPADCYLIKSGNTEILVDAGFRAPSKYDSIAKVYQENVIKKIEKYCTDGVLDFLIVTHADYDHIVGLAVDGGILDYYSNNDEKYIKTIIDFDSPIVQAFSSIESGLTSESNLLVSTNLAKKYRSKRDAAIKKAKSKDEDASHIPAGNFFDSDKMSDENKILAMSNQVAEKWNEETLYRSYFHYRGGNIYRKDLKIEPPDYSHNVGYDVVYSMQNSQNKIDYLQGELKEVEGRYIYSIPLAGGADLQILYNWSYDHLFKHNIQANEDTYIGESSLEKFDSQDHNNISVCFSVVAGENKFVSFGDLGSGETGLINYYKDTSILKNVSCFKASHHGSTGPKNNNGTYTPRENTADLFKLMTPLNVIVTGVAQINKDILENSELVQGSQYQDYYSGLSSVAVIKEKFFENVKAGNPDTKIYCTQIAQHLDAEKLSLISAPFYGDIYVSVTNKSVSVDCSNKGEVEGYVSGYSQKAKHFKFSNIKDGKLLSFQETEYYKAIYENKGKV